MSGWTHRICIVCWRKSKGDREPIRYLSDDAGLCCACGLPDDAVGGIIYGRANPEDMACKGQGPEHEDSEP